MRRSVRRWYDRRTSSASDWSVAALQPAIGHTTVSVVLADVADEAVVGGIVAGVAAVAAAMGLPTDVVVMDSGASLDVLAAAVAGGARVERTADVLPSAGARAGRGEALWKSLATTSGELVVFLDPSEELVSPDSFTGLIGPLITDPQVSLVKGSAPGTAVTASVTDLVARPLINLLFPRLAGVVEPLSASYAARRQLLEQLPFDAGAAVDIGLLVDTLRAEGLDAIAQVDLGEQRTVQSAPDRDAAVRLAGEIGHALLSRVDPEVSLSAELTEFRRRGDGRLEAQTTDIARSQRPPIATVAEYSSGRPAQ